jgi:uncharacterized sulfatase
MDCWVGGLLAQLEEDGLAEDTVVVFWVDHGVGMPRAKRWVNEAGLRVPLIVRWPRAVAPSRRPELVHAMDVAPTLLTVCGIPVPEHMEARPLLDAAGHHLDPNDAVFGARARIDEQEDASLTVRDARYRYVRHAHPDRSPMQHSAYPERFVTWRELRDLAFADADALARGLPAEHLTEAQRSIFAAGRPPEELYDLQADPYQLVNLVDDPARAADLERLRARLDEWQAEYAAPWPPCEQDLIEQWRPGGKPQRTDDPVLAATEQGLVATCSTPGASIGWTMEEPGPLRPRTDVEIITGAPLDDGRHWHLYHRPVQVDAGRVRFRAWRLGFEPSDEVVVDARTAESL